MKLKICGISDIDILKYACELGVDFVGFIMANASPRKISNDFLDSLENFNFMETSPVFVFVNPTVDEVKKITAKIKNPILQFHGDEEEIFCQQFNQPFWKTIRVKNSQSLEAAYGGTGKVFDWSLLENVKLQSKFILAGGINIKNLNDAISLNPWCIDVNSGVESSLALKDKTLMDQIIKSFKNG